MAHSEKKTPWFSKSHVQHYDDSGNKTGKSFDKTNPITNKTKTVHTDQNNNKIGSSENIKDSFTGKTHRQHYDQDGTPTSYTERKKNFFGKYKSYTKSGKKRTTQEYLAAIILIGLAIYFVIKVILPLAFVLTTPVITIIALVNIIKSKNETYFKYSLICSTLFILDYLFNGYSSYLMADESFVSENLYIYVGIAFVCFGLSIILLFYNQLNQSLLKFNIENVNVRKSIAVLLFLVLLTPFYFIENKFLHKPTLDKVTAEKPNLDQSIVDNSSIEKSSNEKPNLDQSTDDNSSIEKTSIEKPNLEQPTTEKSDLERSAIEQPNKSNGENDVYSRYKGGKIWEKGSYVNKKRIGEWIEYHENGQIRYKGNYVNGTMNGEWIRYYKNGQIANKWNYLNGELKGEATCYYKNGQLKVKVKIRETGSRDDWKIRMEEYDKSEASGSWVQYSTLEERVKQREGYDHHNYGIFFYIDKNGKWVEYYENGQIFIKMNFVNRKANGEATRYYDNGQLAEKTNFVNGKKNGEWILYYYYGQIKAKGNYVNGELKGEFIEYNPDGLLLHNTNHVFWGWSGDDKD